MLYQEKKIEEGFHYLNEDVYGIIELYSKEKLDAETLDTLVLHILKLTTPQGDINITYGKSKQQLTVRYKFKAVEQWGEDPRIESTI